MRFSWDPIDLKGILRNLFPHELKPGAGQGEQVRLKNPLQRPVICIDGELGQPVEVKGTLSYSPDYGKAFQLNGGIALLGWGQTFRPTVHNLEVLRSRRVDVDVP